ncbi:hypothetical protein Y10_28040 [Neptunitalea sp. Y10]|uniref:Transposase IS200-like domain-containing protein n=2 Tax=Neptunitalea lumnitzerae TaxID=2965509 RepID=A0ABQ5MLZ3_9FLAO|nr:hypothetical protein Y10_28040 [Neptunitalea sp. Y10]
MLIYAYCIMPSHIHLIFSATEDNPSELLRDFKGYTSRQLIKVIKENPQESRKEWLLYMMKKAGSKNPTVTNKQFWQQHNQPIEIWSPHVFTQKLNYIHQNPVEAGLVVKPEDYKYSSARNYSEDHTVLEIDIH